MFVIAGGGGVGCCGWWSVPCCVLDGGAAVVAALSGAALPEVRVCCGGSALTTEAGVGGWKLGSDCVEDGTLKSHGFVI